METARPGPGRPGVTYEMVAAAAEAIAARGERPSLRTVRAELGSGSLGTIQKHLATWQSQRRQSSQTASTAPTISDGLLRAIRQELDREVAAARATLESELAAAIEARDALAEEGARQAEQIQRLEAQLAEMAAVSQQQAGRIAQLEADLAQAREVAEQLRQALTKAEIAAAVAAERVAGAEARLADAQSREQAALDALKAAEQRAADAERAAAELRARLEAMRQ